MFSRGVWLGIWIVSGVIWTVVIATWGWLNLPRSQDVPHHPEFLNRLSNEAASILVGAEAKPKPSNEGALIWSDVPILVSMPNGARLAFPIATASKDVAFVKNEYLKLLEAEAAAQTGPYVMRLFLGWVLPFPILIALGLAAELTRRAFRRGNQSGTSASGAAIWIRACKFVRTATTHRLPAKKQYELELKQ